MQSDGAITEILRRPAFLKRATVLSRIDCPKSSTHASDAGRVSEIESPASQSECEKDGNGFAGRLPLRRIALKCTRGAPCFLHLRWPPPKVGWSTCECEM